MAKKKFILKGKVVQKTTKKPITGLTIEAWDKDLLIDDLLGNAITGKDGSFTIAFDQKYYSEIIFDRKPDIYFKVFSQGRLIADTLDKVLWNVKTEMVEILIELTDDECHPVDNQSETYTIKGAVKLTNKRLPDGLTVQLFNRDLNGDTLLTKTTVDKSGKYEAEIHLVGSESPAIIAKVYSLDGKEIGSSQLLYNLTDNNILDVVLSTDNFEQKTEYKEYTDVITPYLQGFSLSKLTDDQVKLLAGKTNLSSVNLSLLSKAADLAEQANISTEVVYGLLREGMSSKLSELYGTNTNQLRDLIGKAITANIISKDIMKDLDTLLEKLQRRAIQDILNEPFIQGGTTFNELLKTSGVSDKVQQTFVNAYQTNTGTLDDFWNNLSTNNKDISKNDAKNLRFTVAVGNMAIGHLPLVNSIQQLYKEQKISDIKDLVNWDQQKWLQQLNALQKQAGDNVVPSVVPGNNIDEKKQNYAMAVGRILEQSYPTQYLAARITADSNQPNSKTYNVFFSNNPDFQLGEVNVDSYINENKSALKGIDNTTQFVQDLKTLQRQYLLSPGFDRYNSVKTLQSINVRSSFDVIDKGWKTFSEQYVRSGGTTEMAGVVYEMASHNMAMMQNVQFTYGVDLGISTYATQIPGIYNYLNPIFREDPTLANLFGSLDFCDCKHCRSIYSPAAYLVDLFQFIRKADTNTGSFATCLDVLFNRRPDLCSIELNCNNTNTPLPYIDLVNEILENAVLKVKYGETADYSKYQTNGTAEELQAHPEHIQVKVYNDALKKASYPWSLPLDIWTEEGRVYLAHLKTPRYKVMDAFLPASGYAYLTEEKIVNEILNISDKDRKILLGTASETNQQLWGLTGGTILVNTLNDVDTLLAKSGIQYSDLTLLLKTYFINPAGNIAVVFDTDFPCDLNHATLSNITEDTLMKIQRFTRLRNKLGWGIRDLDVALKAIGSTTITSDTLLKLSHIVRLLQFVKLPLQQLFTLWGKIFTGHPNDDPTERSPYDLLFLNKSVLNPVDNAFILKPDRTDLADLTKNISDHTAAIKAGLGISSSDLELLSGKVLSSGILNLDNLSILYRHAVLAKALKITIKELLSLFEFTVLNPFDLSHTENIIIFILQFNDVKSSKFKIAELNYLFKYNYDISYGVGLQEDIISDSLTDIHLGLKKIYDENRFTSDPQGDATRKKLAIVLNEGDLNTAVSIIEKTSSLSVPDQTSFINNTLSVFLSNPADAVAKLVNPSSLTKKQDRYEYVLNDLLSYLKTTSSKEFLKQKIATNFGLNVSLADLLLFKWIKGPDVTSELSGDVFLENAFITTSNNTIKLADFPKQFNTFVLLHKTSLILRKFKVTSTEIDYLFSNAFDPTPAGWAGWFTFNDLPVLSTSVILPSSLYAQLLRLCDLFKFYHSLPASDENLLDLMKDAFNPASSTTLNQLLGNISDITKWNLDDLKELSNNFFSFTKTSYKDEIPFWRLSNCFDILKISGGAATDVENWVAAELTSDVSSQIVHTIKSLYTETDWLGIAKPLRDVLREKQREALADWLIYNQSGITNSNDLYAYYLVDPEMSACMMTSRIRLALSSVQQFIQRCLMNLEPNVQISNADKEHWNQWKWMKTFRVWEANRKIFCYPENWVEPELRDNKTEFFLELEQELSQNEITDANVEKAYLNYLSKLEAVSNIQILGICKASEELNSAKGYYVFGRTNGKPGILYFRQYKSDGTYSPWKKIDIDFEGDHLIPIVYNNKLTLFWPIFTDQSEKGSIPSANTSGSEPRKYYKIQMAWSEFHNGMWRAKRVSAESIDETKNENFTTYYTPEQFDYGTKRFFVAKNIDTDNNVVLTVYSRIDFNDVTYNQVGGFTFNPSKKVTTIDTTNDILLLDLLTYTQFTNQEFVEWDNYIYALRIGSSSVLGQSPPDKYSVVYVDSNGSPGIGFYPFVYQDSKKIFFVRIKDSLNKFDIFYHPFVSDFLNVINTNGVEALLNPQYNISDVNALSNKLRRQKVKNDFFVATYAPNAAFVHSDFPVENIDFSWEGAYSIYNWELFFHIPMLIADKLSNNQQFEAAQKWYQYVFDPTDSSSEYTVPQRFWKTKPFVEIYDLSGGVPASIQQLMVLLNEGDSDMEKQVEAWRENPFNPHLIARMRISAYQKNVVMKYIDNLFKWGDMLFRQDTMETTNEAAQLYLLAWNILGEEPRMVQGKEPDDKTYCELEAVGIDDFSNAMVILETKLVRYFSKKHKYGFKKYRDYLSSPKPPAIDKTIYNKSPLWFEQNPIEQKINPVVNPGVGVGTNTFATGGIGAESLLKSSTTSISVSKSDTFGEVASTRNDFTEAMAYTGIENLVPGGYWNKGNLITHIPYEPVFIYQVVKTLYFCTPQNDKLLGYWDFVKDRFYKLRNCLNIEGIFRQLPLFDPPIDPAMLVKAMASGMDLSSALNDLNAALPNYRFAYIIEKAKLFTGVVNSLGAELLSVLERKDAEALAQLRALNEIDMLNAITQIKKDQIKEANDTYKALVESKNIADTKSQYYHGRDFANTAEGIQLTLMSVGLAMQIVSEIINLTAAATYAVPTVTTGAAGWAGSPVFVVSLGGQTYGNTASSVAKAMGDIAGLLYQGANLSGIIGSMQRRADDWNHMAALADIESAMAQHQMDAADTRGEIAQFELDNHEKLIEQRNAEFDYLKNKFTNQDLYDWMIGQISSLYFQAYQMAYDLAKRAERSYKYELADSNDSFITYGYWDSLKKGLLAGERLHNDLLRMEASYMEKNKRTYEITKHASLAMINPFALEQLRENGKCFFDIPEELFDLDHPGHYMRRIKSVSLTIPCVAGPYSGVNAKLTLTSNSIRLNTDVDGNDPTNYPKKTDGSETRFKDNLATIQSIATSNGDNDSGLFTLNFNDERYLPFEGAGVISSWQLELPQTFRSFDYNTITDVIVTINYTSKDGGENLKSMAVQHLVDFTQASDLNLTRIFSMKHEFGNEWYQFLNPAESHANHQVDVILQKLRFPYMYHNNQIQIKKLDVILQLKDPTLYNNSKKLSIFITIPVVSETEASLAANTSDTSATYLGGEPVKLDHSANFNIADDSATITLVAKETNITTLPDELKDTTGTHVRLNKDQIENLFFICHYNVGS